jgi:hypothetical protein
MVNKQAAAPFGLLIRPLVTKNVPSRDISVSLEDEIVSLLAEVSLVSPISGILCQILMDEAIAPRPPDYLGYQSKDNSVTVGISIEFALWGHSSVSERLAILTNNVLLSLDKIPARYLLDQDREKLRLVGEKARSRLALRLAG